MTCAHCESDTGEMNTIVVYGGIIFCNEAHLSDYLMETNRWERTEENIQYVESELKVVEQ